MLTDDEILNLPDDPEDAFVEYTKLIWEALQKDLREENGDELHLRRNYVESIFAFDEVHNLKLVKLGNPPVSDFLNQEFLAYFQEFATHVQGIALKIRLEKARKIKLGIVTVLSLDDSSRTAILFHIGKIRETLNGVDIPEKKKESLFNKLNAFTAEVDRNRTRVDALMSLAVEISGTVGKVAENLKPVSDLVDALFKWVGKAKEATEALPPWKERQRIEPPKKQLPGPKDALDDDIPF